MAENQDKDIPIKEQEDGSVLAAIEVQPDPFLEDETGEKKKKDETVDEHDDEEEEHLAEGGEVDGEDDGKTEEVRRIYEVTCFLRLDEDEETKGERAPYILTIDETSEKVLALRRNWEKGDEKRTKLDWVVEFKFIPWRGAYAIGLPHLIGGLSAALTGSLRALLDSAPLS